MALIEVRLRPTGPWRVGHRGGDRERVDVVYHSDALFSAITHAMRALGWLDEWLDVTARATGAPAVRLSSLFPFTGKTRLIAPPKSVWPPAGRGQLYFEGAKLVPLDVLRHGVQDESRWEVDGDCQCLLPVNGVAPFKVVVREAAAVDRITGATEPHRTACLEFAHNAGWWGVFQTTDKLWESRVKSALRLAADSGFGGERSRGWGRSSEPQFNDATYLFPQTTETNDTWWLLSLYSPDPTDQIDWTRSEQTVTVRAGWTDSHAGAAQKKQLRMIEEGAVLSAPSLRGRTVDVAPENFPHPVYRNGIALALPVPVVIEPAAKKPTPPPAAEPTPLTPPTEERAAIAGPALEPELPAADEPATAEPAPLTPTTEGRAAIAAPAPEPALPATNEPATAEPAPLTPTTEGRAAIAAPAPEPGPPAADEPAPVESAPLTSAPDTATGAEPTPSAPQDPEPEIKTPEAPQ